MIAAAFLADEWTSLLAEPRYLKPQQLSPAMAKDHKGKQPIKGHRWDHAHIDRGNRIGVIAQKCLPAL
jgi:hypothetical protein